MQRDAVWSHPRACERDYDIREMVLWPSAWVWALTDQQLSVVSPYCFAAAHFLSFLIRGAEFVVSEYDGAISGCSTSAAYQSGSYMPDH